MTRKTPNRFPKYQKRISGPLLGRIDIHIEVPRVDYEKLRGDRVGEIRRFCKLQDAGGDIVASTIAGLAACEELQSVHLAEALHLRRAKVDAQHCVLG